MGQGRTQQIRVQPTPAPGQHHEGEVGHPIQVQQVLFDPVERPMRVADHQPKSNGSRHAVKLVVREIGAGCASFVLFAALRAISCVQS
jgi:hypothetical protein